MIVVDPRRITLCEEATLWLPQRPGTNVALANGLLHVLLRDGLVNWPFVKAHTRGFEAVAELVASHTPERVGEITGLAPELIIRTAHLYGEAERAILLTGLGLDEHVQGTEGILAFLNLVLATGNVGQPGTGILTLRGQNNVQGACDMGCLPYSLPGYQSLDDSAVRHKFARAWGADLPARPGLTSVGMWEAARRGKLHGLFVFGEDPLRTHADTTAVEEAIGALDFLVVQDLFLTATARLAHVVLPAASFAEKSGTFTNTERRLRLVNQAIPRLGAARPDWEVFAELSARLGTPFPAATAAEVFAEMASLTPSFAGISHTRLNGDGLQWPCPYPGHPGTPRLYEGGFGSTGASFTATEHRPPPVPEGYPLVLITGRRLHGFNNDAQAARSPLIPVEHRERLDIHPADARPLGMVSGDLARISSPRGHLMVRLHLTESQLPGTVFLAFHDPAVPVNRLLDSRDRDPFTETYSYKFVPVKVEKAGTV